jgi:hypothetical protein
MTNAEESKTARTRYEEIIAKLQKVKKELESVENFVIKLKDAEPSEGAED